MVAGIGRRVEDQEMRTVPTDTLKRGDRIVEDHRLVGVVIERIAEPFGGCRTNIHVRMDVGTRKDDGSVRDRLWCYQAGTSAKVVENY